MQCFLSLKSIDITKDTSFVRTFGGSGGSCGQFEHSSSLNAWFLTKRRCQWQMSRLSSQRLGVLGPFGGKPRSAACQVSSGKPVSTSPVAHVSVACLTGDLHQHSWILLRIWCQDAANIVFIPMSLGLEIPNSVNHTWDGWNPYK